MVALRVALCVCVLSTATARAQKRVIAAIGIGTYQDSLAWRDIRPAEQSAQALLNTLKKQFGYTPLNNPLLGRAAVASRVETYLSQVLSQLNADDDLIVFFSGHGIAFEEGGESVGYLAPWDASVPPAKDRLIPIGRLLQTIDNAPAGRVLVILDACESGAGIPRMESASRDSGGAAKTRILITSAGPGQKADAQGASHGATLFTGVLLDLLENGQCDLSGDGYCTATELGLLARRRLSAMGAKQTPMVGAFGGEDTSDFRLRLEPEVTQEWLAAKSCQTVEECEDTSRIEAFLKRYPNSAYAAAATKEVRDRLKHALDRTNQVITSDLRLVVASAAKGKAVRKQDNSEFMWIPHGAGTGADDQAFWMQKFEVSVQQFRDFLQGAPMPRAPSFNRSWNEDAKQPMVNVSWYQAQTYCASVGGALPSAKQWERAARAGKNQRFPWGDEENPDDQVANLAGARDDEHLFAAPVDAYPHGENDWQIRNLIGNVSEWTSDRSKTDTGKAVAVGGSFAETWQNAGFQWRSEVELPGSNTVGFRCIVIPERGQ